MTNNCPDCGEAVKSDANFCSQCGSDLTDSKDAPDAELSPEDTDENVEKWNPAYPITSIFASIMLLWSALHYGGLSLLIFGGPAILIIPRVRRYIAPWIEDQFNKNPTSTEFKLAVGGLYAIFLLMATLSVIGSTASNPSVGGPPTRQLSVGLVTIAIMFGTAAVIVTAIRINRRLRE